jgi:arylsulfatase A-like enzyme
MKVKIHCIIVFMVLGLGLFSCKQKPDSGNEKQVPNIVFILADDAGWADFGCYGATDFKTPHIDKMASDGVLLTQAYVSGSVCCPSRAGILTGRYQQRFGHEYNGPDAKPMPGFTQDDLGLDVDEKTMGNYMQSLGYTTCFVGKWNMGLRPQFLPWNRGFNDFFGFLGGARSYFTIEDNPVNEHFVMIKDQKVFPEDSITYLTDDLTDYAIEFINKNKENPFFVFVSYNAVHTPMHAKESDIALFPDIKSQKRRINAAMTKSLDDNLGKINETLARLELEENTLVIFFNDNGGSKQNASNNGQLRDFKGSHYEGGIRVPCIVKWPRKIAAGHKYNEPVIGLDFLPTIYKAAGGDRILGNPFDGADLMPFLKGDSSGAPHHTLYWHMAGSAAIRDNNWKVVKPSEGDYELYNLKEDLSEKVDLSSQFPDKKEELINKLQKWESELEPPKWTMGGGWIEFDIAGYLKELNQ